MRRACATPHYIFGEAAAAQVDQGFRSELQDGAVLLLPRGVYPQQKHWAHHPAVLSQVALHLVEFEDVDSETGWECGWAEADCIHDDQDDVAGTEKVNKELIKSKQRIDKM